MGAAVGLRAGVQRVVVMSFPHAAGSATWDGKLHPELLGGPTGPLDRPLI